MPLKIALALLFAGCCAPKPVPTSDDCVTRCGMIAPAGVKCASLGALEATTVRVLGALEWSPATVCKALHGWQLVLMYHDPDDECPTGWKEAGLCVVGFTRINTRTVALLGPKLPASTYAHEVVHVVELETKGTTNHCGWKRRGIAAALFEIGGEPDYGESLDRSCSHDGS